MSFVTFKTFAESVHYGSTIGVSTWVGVSDIQYDGTYYNYYGNQVSVGSLIIWYPGEPNNGFIFQNEDCIDILGNSNKFNDGNCGSSEPRAGCMSESSFNFLTIFFTCHMKNRKLSTFMCCLVVVLSNAPNFNSKIFNRANCKFNVCQGVLFVVRKNWKYLKIILHHV